MIISTDDDNDHGDDDDNELDDEDQICNNSANFQARSSTFCMVVDVDHSYTLIYIPIPYYTLQYIPI